MKAPRKHLSNGKRLPLGSRFLLRDVDVQICSCVTEQSSNARTAQAKHVVPFSRNLKIDLTVKSLFGVSPVELAIRRGSNPETLPRFKKHDLV